MTKYITFGNWNKNYLYIIASCISAVAFDVINGYGYYFYSLQLSDSRFNGHIYIHKLFYYLLILICATLFHFYENWRDKNKKVSREKTIEDLIIINDLTLIHNDINDYTVQKIPDSFVFWILFVYIIYEFIDQLVRQFFGFGDFWMVELLIMTYLCVRIFKVKIYQHQLISIYLISIPFLLKVATMVLFFCNENNHLKDGEINYKYNDEDGHFKSLFVAHGWLFPISFALYFITMVMDSYITISIKKIMDVKYVSITYILIIYGAFGAFFTLLFSSVVTFISCGKKNDKIYDIYDYICQVVDENNDRYIENYRVYFSMNIGIDLFYSLLRGIANGLYYLFMLKYVQTLSPVFKSFRFPMMYFLQKSILLYHIKSDEPMKFLNARFFIDLSSDFTAFICFLIYLEIIELHFCNLNKNLRKYIIMRANIESKPREIVLNDMDVSFINDDND